MQWTPRTLDVRGTLRRFLGTRIFLLAVMGTLALATWPGWWNTSDFALGLSSNLFASVVTTALTIFGVNVLLSRIEARALERRQGAARDELLRSLTWIFNRFHAAAPTVVAPIGGPHIREDFPDVLTAYVQANGKELQRGILDAPWAEVGAALKEIQERVPHLRLLLAVATDAVSSESLAHLIRAMGVVEAASGYGVLTQEEAEGDRFLSQVALRMLLGEAILEFAAAYAELTPVRIPRGTARSPR